MIPIRPPVRAYKRLIYVAFACSFLCFLAIHLAISSQRVGTPYELSIDGHPVTGAAGQQFYRGLLQKLPSFDYIQSTASDATAAAAAATLTANQSVAAAVAPTLTAAKPTNTASIVAGSSTTASNNGRNKNEQSAPPPPSPSSSAALPSQAAPVVVANNVAAASITVPSSDITPNLGVAAVDNKTPNESKLPEHEAAAEEAHLVEQSMDYISHYLDVEPHIDTSPALSEDDQLTNIEVDTNNLALSYWLKARKYPKPNAKTGSSGKACRVEFPSPYELEYNNVYWQKFTPGNSSFYLYNAYYDDRWRGGPLPMVRILAMIDRVQPPPALCQIWFDRISVPIISQATYIYGWYNKWGNYKDGVLQPYIVTCKIPRIKGLPRDFYPTSVSLVENRCNKATNNLRIVNHRPEKKEEFAVCVKGLDFLHEDLSVRLVEWIELLRLLGASKIFLYELEIHPNITKVLEHYQQEGLVQLTKITLPGNQPNLPGFRHLYLKNKLTHKRQNELVPYNDCLYRNLFSYNYLALLDIDEVIMPLQHANWSQLMAEIQRLSWLEKNYTRASYNVRNVYFLDDLGADEEQMRHEAHESGIPRYLHMLQHVYRSQNYTKPGQYVKCFHNTERAVSLHNHFPLNCFGTCTTYSVPVQLAHLQHYRKDCVGPLKNSCKDFRAYTTRDTTIFRYKDELIHRTTKVLRQLNFFENDTLVDNGIAHA